jgi:2-polyprenyl-3-methyl-5-hydroxy-6-metoxy-1,4-benzoquinol methylase
MHNTKQHSFSNRLFAKFESAFAEVYNGPSKITKQNLFAPLHTLISSDWKLKNNGLIRILEIGCGNGMRNQ